MPTSSLAYPTKVVLSPIEVEMVWTGERIRVQEFFRRLTANSRQYNALFPNRALTKQSLEENALSPKTPRAKQDLQTLHKNQRNITYDSRGQDRQKRFSGKCCSEA
ncbi:hypothetical protein SUGI_0496040 [Cryptomeria japonica]|nr:hypothetical protein SUGI_0496040 [Cryptomeria japonica]